MNEICFFRIFSFFVQIDKVSCEQLVFFNESVLVSGRRKYQLIFFLEYVDVNFYFDPSTSQNFGNLSNIREPYELSRVSVNISTVESPQAGRGMFALRDFEEKEVLAFYTGSQFFSLVPNPFTDVPTYLGKDLFSFKLDCGLKCKLSNLAVLGFLILT